MYYGTATAQARHLPPMFDDNGLDLYRYYEAGTVEIDGEEQTAVYPLDEAALEASEYGYFDGPMMSVFWPLTDSVRQDDEIREMALKLVDLAVCLVEIDGEDSYELGFALTGGGMWLGDHLATAYARLGFAVPEDIASSRNMASANLEPCVYEAMRATAEYLEGQASRIRGMLPE